MRSRGFQIRVTAVCGRLGGGWSSSWPFFSVSSVTVVQGTVHTKGTPTTRNTLRATIVTFLTIYIAV